MKKNLTAAIDVGTTKICTILAEVDAQGNINVLGEGTVPSRGLHKGLVVNISEAKDSIKASIKKAEHSSELKIKSARVGVTGSHTSSFNERSMVSITHNDHKVSPNDLRRVLDAARSAVPNTGELLHAIPRQYIVNNSTIVDNPLEMQASRLDVEMHFVTAEPDSIQNLTKCIRELGVKVESIVLEPLASAKAVLTPDEREVGVILADIGGGTTDVAVFKGRNVWYSSILPVGGYQLTNDLAVGLKIPFNVAEELKKKYGDVFPNESDLRKKIKTVGLGLENGYEIIYQNLVEITKARIEEILRLIHFTVSSPECKTTTPAGIVLTGGSANLPGIEIAAQQVLNLPARIGSPHGMRGLSDTLFDPAYATGVGLLLWGKSRKGEESWQSRSKKQETGFGRIFKRFSKIFKK